MLIFNVLNKKVCNHLYGIDFIYVQNISEKWPKTYKTHRLVSSKINVTKIIT